MALQDTPIYGLGWKAPVFSLPGVDGSDWTLNNAKGPNGLVTMFICKRFCLVSWFFNYIFSRR